MSKGQNGHLLRLYIFQFLNPIMQHSATGGRYKYFVMGKKLKFSRVSTGDYLSRPHDPYRIEGNIYMCIYLYTPKIKSLLYFDKFFYIENCLNANQHFLITLLAKALSSN